MGIIKNRFGHCNYSFEDDYVHIFNLYVFPKFRKQGKARELLKSAIKKIRKAGYTGVIEIVADPHENNIDREKLTKFYKSLGLDVFEYYG